MLNKCPTERICHIVFPFDIHINNSCLTDNKAMQWCLFCQRNGNAILLNGNGIRIKINIEI